MAEESRSRWEKELIAEIQETAFPKIAHLRQQLDVLGMAPEEMEKSKKIVVTSIQEMLEEYIQEVEEKQEKLAVEIKGLLQTSERLCKELSIDLPEYGKDNLGFYKERDLLIEKVAEFEAMRATRIKEIEHLENCERHLCRNLGRTPKGLKSFPLPSQKHILAFETYLEELEREKFERREQFCIKKQEIIQLINELGVQPFMDFERIVIEKEDDAFLVTDTNMEQLQEFYESLVKQLSETKEEMDSLSKRIEKLWNVLETDMQERDIFRKKCVGNFFERIAFLKEELKNCEVLKCKNIQLFIEKLRGKMLQLWDKMQYTQQQRDAFPFFNTTVFTEDLLEIHERELQRLEAAYEQNREIYGLLAKHKELWEKMKEFEKSEEQPDRYKNRGGQLLKEEKERNKLSKRVTLTEEKLTTLAEQFYIREGTPLLVYGRTIEEYINDLHEAQKAERMLRMSAKKQQREQALTPGKSGLLASVSSMRTPATASKRKIATPSFNTDKKLRLALFREGKGTKTAPVGRAKVTVRTHTKIRTSLDKIKKLNKSRGKNIEYTAFESDVENLDPNKRSTTLLNVDTEELATPLFTTPSKSKPRMVLTTPRGRSQNLKV